MLLYPDVFLFVESRSRAHRFCHAKHDRSSVIVSISSPLCDYDQKIFRSEENGVKDILRLEFCDADQHDVENHYCEEDLLMTDEDADRVVAFVEKNVQPGTDIIVHCDAGISRSAAVAAAIARHYTGDDSCVFDSGLYRPNMWCYRKMMNAYARKEGSCN